MPNIRPIVFIYFTSLVTMVAGVIAVLTGNHLAGGIGAIVGYLATIGSIVKLGAN